MDEKGSPQVIGREYILSHEKVSFSDNDILFIDSLDSLNDEESTMLINMVLVIVGCSGKLQVDHNGTPISIEPKDMLICPPGVKLDNFKFSKDFHAVIVGLSYEKFQKTVCSGREIWSLLLYASKHPVFHLSDIDMNITEGYRLVAMKKLQTSREFYYNEIMNAIMEAIFYEICVVIKREKSARPDEDLGQGNQIFKRFVDAITKNGGKNRSVAYFADILCVTPKHLSFIARSVSGKPALEWILEHCTEGIVHELKYSDKSIKEISNEFGFPTISAFGKFVKKRLGVSPRHFRSL